MSLRYILVGTWMLLISLPSISYAQVPFAPGELLIKLKPTPQPLFITLRQGAITTGLPSLDSLNRRFKANSMEKIFRTASAPTSVEMPDLRNWYKIKVPEGTDILRAAQEYKKDPNVIYAEPNYIYRKVATPNDTYYGNQWYLPKIEAPSAWDVERGVSSIIIAIVDSGVDIDHPDLAGKIWTNPGEIPGDTIDNDSNGYVDDVNGWDFVTLYNNAPADNDPNPEPDGLNNDSLYGIDDGVEHGTYCAGIAAAVTNNATGISGLGWDCCIMPIRVLSDEGDGWGSEIAAGIIYAADKGAKVINLSLGGPFSNLYDSVITHAYNLGCAIVAAAGNGGDDGIGDDIDVYQASPVCNDGGANKVIGVAATDINDIKPAFSNYGSTYVDVCAPGVNIFSTVYYNPTYGFNNYYEGGWNGTSMSTPLVAGLAGLLFSHNPGWSNLQVRQRIEQTADNLDRLNPDYKGRLGSGRINAFNALSPTQPQPPPVKPPPGRFGIRKVYNYPNPFILHSGQTTIRIELGLEVSPDNIDIEIYDIAGELVHKVESSDITQSGRIYEYYWDGKNDQGREVGSGVYIYRIRVEGDGKEEVFYGKLAVVR